MKHKKEVITLFGILVIATSFLIIYKPSIIGYVTSNMSVFIPNSSPNLTTNIPDQTWSIDTANNDAFDLSDYLSDPNLDPLTYTVIGNSSITIEINPSTNMVSFSQPTGWTGTEYVTFNATDDDGGTVESNNVSLTVTSAPLAGPPTGAGPGGAAVAPAPVPKPPAPIKAQRRIFYIDFTVEDEVTVTASKDDIVMVTFDGVMWHRTDTEEIAEDSATLIMYSTPITIKLRIGETKEIDVNEDRIGDVSMTLISVKDGMAKSKFKKLAGGIIISEEKPLFDVDMKILPDYQRVFTGDPTAAEIKIYNFGIIPGVIGIRIDYFIKDLKGNIIKSFEYEIRTVETQIEYVKEITVPEDLETGRYELEAHVLHYNKIAISSAPFEVIKKPILKRIPLLVLIIIVLAVIIIAFTIHRKRAGDYKERRSLVKIIKDFKKNVIKR